MLRARAGPEGRLARAATARCDFSLIGVRATSVAARADIAKNSARGSALRPRPSRQCVRVLRNNSVRAGIRERVPPPEVVALFLPSY